MNPALSADALYSKSQLYIRRGFRAKGDGDFEEYQLWASLALELLGKAVLANVHPALIADPQHHQSIFSACGRDISHDVRTITAKTLFGRLRLTDKTFDSRHQDFCEQISIRRNTELHSGESPFSGMKPELWEREYWGAIVVLLDMQGQDLESWLGTSDAKVPAEIVEKADEARQWAVSDRIRRAADDFEARYKNPEQRMKVIEQAKSFRWWEQTARFYSSPDSEQREQCPSCGANALLLGTKYHEEVVDSWPDEEMYLELVEQYFAVDEFFCPACGLHLFGSDEIAAADLTEGFSETAERDREFEEEYMNE